MKRIKICPILLVAMLCMAACRAAPVGTETSALSGEDEATAVTRSETTEEALPDTLSTESSEATETAETAEAGKEEATGSLNVEAWDEYDWKTMLSASWYPFPLTADQRAVPTDELIDIIFCEDNAPLFDELFPSEMPSKWRDDPEGYLASRKLQRVIDDNGRTFVVAIENPYEAWWYFNGFRELETREDAIPCLLEAYRASDTDDSFGENKMNREGYLLMQCLEVVLSQEVYQSRMTAEERATLYELIEGFHGADRSQIPVEGFPVADQSYRFYPYAPVSDE